MGVQLSNLVFKRECSKEELKNHKIAIDAFNYIYQFLSSIRQRDGTPLKDSKDRVTSHLSGLFYRNLNLLKENITPIYVFDGEPPELKREEINKRKEVREKAKEKWEEKKEKGEFTSAKKYAKISSKIEKDTLKSSKKLLDLMGIPIVQAPSEGEAQAAFMVQKGYAWAVASQDYDSLLYGAPRTIRNLVKKNPKIIYLKGTLEKNEISREQLVEIAILIGTDFNPGGIKGVGPKKGLKIVRKNRFNDFKSEFDLNPHEIKELFLNPNISQEFEIERKSPNSDGIREMLKEYDFSEKRVEKGIKRLEKSHNKIKQKNLESWV